MGVTIKIGSAGDKFVNGIWCIARVCGFGLVGDFARSVEAFHFCFAAKRNDVGMFWNIGLECCYWWFRSEVKRDKLLESLSQGVQNGAKKEQIKHVDVTSILFRWLHQATIINFVSGSLEFELLYYESWCLNIKSFLSSWCNRLEFLVQWSSVRICHISCLNLCYLKQWQHKLLVEFPSLDSNKESDSSGESGFNLSWWKWIW